MANKSRIETFVSRPRRQSGGAMVQPVETHSKADGARGF
jgi:hypothetical protein